MDAIETTSCNVDLGRLGRTARRHQQRGMHGAQSKYRNLPAGKDSGCRKSPRCLDCPLPECIYDKPPKPESHWYAAPKSRRQVRQLLRAGHCWGIALRIAQGIERCEAAEPQGQAPGATPCRLDRCKPPAPTAGITAGMPSHHLPNWPASSASCTNATDGESRITKSNDQCRAGRWRLSRWRELNALQVAWSHPF